MCVYVCIYIDIDKEGGRERERERERYASTTSAPPRGMASGPLGLRWIFEASQTKTLGGTTCLTPRV